MKQINWGILAPGRIAHKFARDLELVEGAKLHAVASRSMERAEAFAQEYGAPHAFGRYEDLLDCPGLDVVYVASPHSGHCEHALMCLERGIAVLCEKPLAVTAAQAQRMVEAARRNETFLMEAIWTRFIPLFDTALKLVDAGTIGELKTIRADFGFKANFPPEHRLFNLELAGGALLDVGIYPLFLATLLWGRPIEVKATAIFGPTGTDDSCAMLLRYPGDRLAMLDCSVVLETGTEAYLYGDKGTLRLHRRFHHPNEMSVAFYDKPTEFISKAYSGIGYYHEIVEVHECLRAGKTESAKLPLDFSLILLEVMDWVRAEAGIVYPPLQV